MTYINILVYDDAYEPSSGPHTHNIFMQQHF